ncbi:DUF4349 domain-containing protein [Streptomyces scopuliridis]|uniref:DUF4349 domain-containing protein n=1 Tax=Streptomyces scopuliridis TaxID=452529 RepID=A0ACD4ZGF5_9ACTN|nr:DUF4349 domain-containing protein [Streptomyces scopuliridis]WSB97106.1 DUF4349 domain-containing protein [Streptomyces scopuliridis]WSC09190.1 DUF4349 domain-containing protein [Streptomyces scopuliridis]
MRAMPAFAAALLTVSLALAGCSASDGGDNKSMADSAAKPVQAGRADAADAESGAGAPASGSEGTGAKQQPAKAGTHVIRTAELTVRVKNTEKALATARAAAVNSGGLIENESTERIEGDHVGSRIVLRVPQDAYDEVLAELAGTGTLVARKADAKDVTDQVVDVNSRIASQRASVARVRELMDQATRLSDVVSLEGELSTRQAALESLLAQQASLKDRTSLATITLELTEAPVVKKEKKEDDPGFLDALGGGWDALTTTVRWIGVVIGAVAPFAAVLAVLYLLWRLVRGRLPRRPEPVPAPRPTPAPSAEPSPAPDGPAAEGTRED